jgi:hemerythrin
MKKLIWKDEYDIGDDKIDSQHRELFDIANEILGDSDKKDRKDRLRVVLHRLFKYMSFHFKDEESFMLSIEYPDYQKHKEFHEKLINELTSVIKSVKDLNVLEDNLYLLMDDWLLKHILKYDVKIKEWHTKRIRATKHRDSQDETIILHLD